MANNLEALETWAAVLLARLEPGERNKLARSIGQELRRSQQKRVIAQENRTGVGTPLVSIGIHVENKGAFAASW